MLTESVTVGDLVARTSDVLHRHTGRPEFRSTTSTSPTTVVVADAAGIAGGTLLEAEVGWELFRVRSTAGTTLTVQRGFANTPQVTDSYTGGVLKDPAWPKATILRGLSDVLGTLHTQVPFLKSTELTVAVNDYYLNLSAVSDLWVPKRLGLFNAGHWVEIPQWEFIDDVVSTTEAGVTRFITLPPGPLSGEKVILTYKAVFPTLAYASPPALSTALTLPLGVRDLIPLLAAARLLSNREVTRVELDRVEEWPQGEAARSGWTLRAVNQLWQEAYRRLDEVVRGVKETEPKHRPYRKASHARWRRGV